MIISSRRDSSSPRLATKTRILPSSFAAADTELPLPVHDIKPADITAAHNPRPTVKIDPNVFFLIENTSEKHLHNVEKIKIIFYKTAFIKSITLYNEFPVRKIIFFCENKRELLKNTFLEAVKKLSGILKIFFRNAPKIKKLQKKNAGRKQK